MLPVRTRSLAVSDPSIRSMADAVGVPLRRAMEIVGFDAETRTVELAFSSDAEVERWGDIEILDHSPGAVILDRLNGGANLLFNHDFDAVLGVVESARIDSDRKGRAFVRFGRSTFAEEKWRDVQDGILRSVSVGYRIVSIELTEKRASGVCVYTVTKWEPIEISIVTVPVDTTAGINRNLNPSNNSFMKRSTIIALLTARAVAFDVNATDEQLSDLLTRSVEASPNPQPTPRVQVINEPAPPSVDDERSRVRSIRDFGKKYKMADIADKAIDDGLTIEEFRALALEEYDKRSQVMSDSHNGIGMSDKEVRSFSFLKLMSTLSEPQSRSLREAAAFELDVCRSAADKSTRNIRGVLIPADVLSRNVYGQRADIISVKEGAGYTGTVGNLVATTLLTSSFVDMLRNRAIVMRRANLITGLVGNVDVPKQTGDTAANWIGEDDEAPKTDVDFGMLALTPHTVAGYSQITRRSLMQSSLDMEAFTRSRLAKAIAEKVDHDAFYGDGTANAPVGIRHSNPHIVPFAAVNPTFIELVAMETALEEVNIDPAAAAYVARARFRGYAKTARKFPGEGEGGTIWEPGNTVNGYTAEITNQIVAGDVFYCDFSWFAVGMWGGLDIMVDPYTDSKRGRINVIAMQDFDFEALRPEAFAYGAMGAEPDEDP